MDETNFNRLLERYVAGEVTEQEMKKIEAWFEARKTRGEENDALSQHESEELFNRITSNISTEDDITSLRPTSAIKRNKSRLVIGIAASIAALFLVALILFNPELLYDQATIATERVILNDGTIVWLRGESEFNYYEVSGTRNGTLRGEALFEIAKDPTRPFSITFNDYKITVIGTSFTLRTQGDSLEVKVLTGKVRLTTTNDSSGIVLHRFESARMGRNQQLLRSSFNDGDVASIIANTEYDMSFTNTTMKEVVDKLSAKFNVEFKFGNDRIGNCLVTADFTDHSLESTTAMLADALNTSFKREGKVILVEGSGCDN